MTTYSWQVQSPIEAFIFDCDGTLCGIEGIDELARQNGVGSTVEQLTSAGMSVAGMSPSLYQERLSLIKPTRGQVIALGQTYWQHLAPDTAAVMQILNRLNKSLYIVSAGLHLAVQGVGTQLHIPASHIYAVNLEFDNAGNYIDFDHDSPLTRTLGKRDIISQLNQQHTATLFMGDGINDYEAHDLVTRFIGYGGFFYREHIAAQCDFYIKTPSITPLLALGLTQNEYSQLTPSEQALYQHGLTTILNHHVALNQGLA